MMLPGSVAFEGRRILLKYHRLLSGTGAHPPNSLSALREVVQGGAEVIEFDIHAIEDGEYLLIHDDTLERETTGAGPVRNITRASAKTLRLRGSAEPAVLLSDLSQVLAGHRRPLKVQVDLKDLIPFRREEARRLLRALEPLRANSHLDVVVGCLGDWNLRALRRLDATLRIGLDFALYLDVPDPEFPRLPLRVNVYGYLDDHPLGYMQVMPVRDYLEERIESLCHLLPGAVEVYLHVELLLRAIADGINPVELVRRELGGVPVDTWTLNAGAAGTAGMLQAVLDAGVDQITTDTAVQLATLITARDRNAGTRERGDAAGR